MIANGKEIVVAEPGDVWFFAYGSLMWNPGFKPKDTLPATLEGWHRRFCISSINYRGKPERPGLCLGLDIGGECRGLALKISAMDRDEVFAYLARREMLEEIYSCVPVTINIEGELAAAYTLVVNTDHKLYVSDLTFDEMVDRITNGHGKRGSNRDYLVSTVKHLETIGIKEEGLSLLLAGVNKLS